MSRDLVRKGQQVGGPVIAVLMLVAVRADKRDGILVLGFPLETGLFPKVINLKRAIILEGPCQGTCLVFGKIKIISARHGF